jgi:hypothetical protein
VSTGAWALVAVGLIVAIGNVLLMGPLLTSPGLTSSETLRQALLMWLVPGSFLFVGRTVRESWAGDPSGEPPNPLLHTGNTNSEVLARQQYGRHSRRDAGWGDGDGLFDDGLD